MIEFHIDFSNIHSAGAFHTELAKTLSLPDWYGENLDALFDCLTELESPVHLILDHWDDSVDFSGGFRSVFEDAQEENPDFTVVFH